MVLAKAGGANANLLNHLARREKLRQNFVERLFELTLAEKMVLEDAISNYPVTD